MPVYYFIDANGDQCFVEMARRPSFALGRVPRIPAPFERWNPETRAFDYDVGGHADDMAGPAHIAAMRARKVIEAHLIAAGVVAPGLLLVREAELRGVDPAELAAIVLEKAAHAEAVELERQAASLPLSTE